ncbi:MAG: NUDIX domain-containing protein [Bacteroidales bacterium]|nr:NUDIX domain-containing protein [Bacteroidales bacterium]
MRRSADKDTRQECLPAVLENGIVIGRASRNYCHGGSALMHPVVHLHIIDRNGDIYLQKRSLKKDIQPGKWDTAVGGHVSYGESFAEALFREASEELGLTRFNASNIDTYVFENGRDRELVSVFACVGHPNLKPDPEEVSEGRWWGQDEIEENLGSGLFTPNFENEYRKIIGTLNALL